ncbi:hypothetical protein BGW41_006647 [Actinomortierella wolfii]|nr:hypothetical protein BGW41_006647 [Actinomortierella wolfii]
MSSLPKHSFEQAYDHAFPPSPPSSPVESPTERSPLIGVAPSNGTLQPYSYSSTASSPSHAASTERDPLHQGKNVTDREDHHLESGRPALHRSELSSRALSLRKLTIREFRILIRYSGPVIVTYILQNSFQLASLVSLGHLGPLELAASSLASMFAAVTCWSTSLGVATALDTLCSQSYTSHHPHTLGLHLQRAILILMLLFVPIAGVWLSSTHIFALLGQEPDVAEHAAIFLRGLLPGAPAYLIFECVKKYLQAQGIMHASTLVLLIASPINILLNYLLVWNKYIGMGYIGAPIATSLSYWTMLGLLILYIRFVDGSAGWGGWSRDALTGWPAFMKLAIPGALMVCTEWWAFEAASLAASYFGTIALAAQSIVVQTSGLLYTIPFGISIAASNRVGNLIGRGDHRSAKVASRCSIALSVVFGTFNSIVLILCKEHWGRLFSDDAEVIGVVAAVLPLVALFQISDGLAGVGGGVLRGVGLQHLGAYLNLIAYYLVAFPIGYFLGFYLNWGLSGLWWALCVGLWTIGLGETAVILHTDWETEVQRCKRRNDAMAKRRASLEAEIAAEFPEADDDH